jgi:hypothetical protein
VVAVSFDAFADDLRRFSGGKQMSKLLRKRLREPVPAVRRAIKRRALATMPRSGGLNRRIAAVKITARISFTGRGAGVLLRGSQDSARGKADLRRLDDAGRIRHPSWGRRGKGQWHTQIVPARWFTGEAAEYAAWRDAIDAAVADACKEMAGG